MDKRYKQALEAVREENLDEIKATLAAAIQIRDDPKTPARDKVNAMKVILHIMGAPRPAETRVTGQEKQSALDPTAWDPSPEEKARLDSILREN